MDLFIPLGIIAAVIAFFVSLLIVDDIQKADVPIERKIAAFLVDYIHVLIDWFKYAIILSLIWDICVLKTFDIRKVLFINIMYTTMVTGVTIYGMCPLTILYNKLLNIHRCTPFSAGLNYRLDKQLLAEKNKNFYVDNENCHKNTKAWWKGQIYSVMSVLLINVIFFIHYIITP